MRRSTPVPGRGKKPQSGFHAASFVQTLGRNLLLWFASLLTQISFAQALDLGGAPIPKPDFLSSGTTSTAAPGEGLNAASRSSPSTESTTYSWQPPRGVLLAQSDGEDAYDPFADYSEFEESMDEEEDINFFRNGRLLTMGFNFGGRGFTQTLGQIYSATPTFGLFMSYFFDLRFALQIAYLTSDHALNIPARNGASSIQGTVNITDLSFTLKYYFNTQNVTRGLADLNPYVITGFSQIYRTSVVSGNNHFSKDSAFGFDIGGGIEFPMMRNKMYFGGQFMYQIVNFADEGREIQDQDDRSTGVSPIGDSWNFLGVLGINF